MIDEQIFRNNPDAFDLCIGIENSRGEWDGTFSATMSHGPLMDSERIAICRETFRPILPPKAIPSNPTDILGEAYRKARAYGFRQDLPDGSDYQNGLLGPWPEEATD
jgi:hypothetical protein